MYPGKYHTEVFLLAFSMLLLFAPSGIAQPEATSNQQQQSSDDKSQSQSTSSSTSDLTPTTAIESINRYTNDTTAKSLKAQKQHNEHNLDQEKTTDSASRPSFKGYIRKFQQYQTLPEGAVTQQQQPPTRQNFYAPDYPVVPSQPQQTQIPTPNGYVQQQVPYPDQYTPYAVPRPGLYDPNQYPSQQRYVQPAPGNGNQYRFPRVTPWRFFGGGCF